jgi:uncharacterized protein
MGHDIAAALALVLVLEGILPFASPGAVRRALQAMNELTDNQLRSGGLVSMLLGLLLLYFINR